ncbi:hypothetical protein ACCS33_37365, partial [Rhizobium ruizarguesonis]
MTSLSRQKKGAFAFRPSLARLVTTKRLLARIVLFFEQLLPPLMPVLSVIAFYFSDLDPGSDSRPTRSRIILSSARP